MKGSFGVTLRPVAIDTDVERYLAGRRAALDREIEEVARLADQGKLDGVDLTGGELIISPVQASTPPEAEKVKEAAYALLPTSKITDVLLDVDSWTGFTDCFTHQRHGRPPFLRPRTGRAEHRAGHGLFVIAGRRSPRL